MRINSLGNHDGYACSRSKYKRLLFASHLERPMTTFKEAQNQAKQIKNAKRGGYTPTVAKDVNKQLKQKLIKVEKHLDEIFDQKWDEWKTTADMHSQGFADGIEYAQQQLRELLK